MASQPLHIVFCGTSAFALPSLRMLCTEAAFAVDAVITQEDKPVGRKQLLTAPPIKELALSHNLRVLQPKNIRKEFLSLSLPRPDFLVVVSYGQILSQDILDFPTVAAVNVHASLLPRWRGASPIQHAILAGDKETGVTVQKMALALDAGPILGQSTVEISSRETASSLHDRLATEGATLLLSTLLQPLKPVLQNEARVTHCTKLTREDGYIDPSRETAEAIDRKVRGLTPWPGVTWKEEDLKILQSTLTPEPDSAPLPCADGTTLHLVSVQPAGKKPMSGAAWMRGRH